MLVQAVHQCAVKFPAVAGSVVHLLMASLLCSASSLNLFRLSLPPPPLHTAALTPPRLSTLKTQQDFLSDSNTASALDVAFFVREIAETNVSLREAIVQRLLDYFYQIRSGRVCVCVLWIIGEYCTTADELDAALAQLKGSLGPLPFLTPQKENEASSFALRRLCALIPRPCVLASCCCAVRAEESHE